MEKQLRLTITKILYLLIRGIITGEEAICLLKIKLTNLTKDCRDELFSLRRV